MIEAGHTNALDYGYSFFIDALNEHEYVRGRNMKDIAIALRVARFADEKGWKKFLRKK